MPNDERAKAAKMVRGWRPGAEWSRGYYCAVAALLREHGCVTPNVRELYNAGNGMEFADTDDLALFREHGLMPHNYK